MAVIPADLAPRTRRRAGEFANRLGRLAAALAERTRASSRVARARAGYTAGVATATWGTGVQFGLGWALMAGGIATAVSFLLLYPVDAGRGR